MGIFTKKNASKDDISDATTVMQKVVHHNPVHITSVIVKPRITEKAMLKTDSNVYTFEVQKNASKYEIRDAIKAMYNVTPIKVNIVQKSPRQYMSRARGRKMTEHGMRKAYVYLKKSDHIELI
jgi:large subunit ribosomal protein L23